MAVPSFFDPAVPVLFLAAVSYSAAHGTRLLVRCEGWLKWTAGVLFGFVAFLVGRMALAGAGWLVFGGISGAAVDPLTLVDMVGLTSTPLLLAFVHATPYFGRAILRVLYGIALLDLTTLSSRMLGVDWLGTLGRWATAWLMVYLASLGIKWLLRNARWLAWTGILGVAHPSPAEVMAKMPGMNDAIWE